MFASSKGHNFPKKIALFFLSFSCYLKERGEREREREDPYIGKSGRQKKRMRQLDGIIDGMNMNMADSGGTAVIHGVVKTQTQLNNTDR